MIYELLGLFLLVLASGFFSSAELAYVVSNKLKIEVRARMNNLSAKNALYYIHNPQIFFSTILIANNIINIAFASLITVFLASRFGLNETQILLISTFIIFLFGELMPKLAANELSDVLFSISVTPIRIITFLLYPFVKAFSAVANVFTGKARLQEEGINRIYHREEIADLISESVEAGEVDERDSDILKKVIEMSDQKVAEAMTPRTEIVGVEINTSIDEAIDIFIESGFSKLPVYVESLDHIKGIILAYDMFKRPESIESIIREVPFIPETKRSLETLNELLSENVSMAVVVDEFGGTAGIVTIEDIIEEMVGEIRDEYDVEDEVMKKLSDNTFLFSGKVEIDAINEEFNLGIPEGEYETIAGYIITKLGRIPKKGEKISIDNFVIEILFAEKTKIDLIKLRLKERKAN